jgi:glycosyltransferase involved in cell wall biosynthesis
MKKLIYIAYVEKNKSIGVINKVNDQCHEFANYYETILICLEESNIYIKNFNTMEERYIANGIYNKNFKENYLRKVFNRVNIIKFNSKIKTIILKEKPDIIYIRKYEILNGIRMIRKMKKKNNTYIIHEIPTYPYYEEMKKNSNYLIYLLNKMLDKMLDKISDLIPVILGKEVEFKCSKYLPVFNGINISNINVNKHTTKKDRIDLIGVAKIEFWHGYDRVIKGLKDYYDSRMDLNVYFHLVGDGPELTNLKKMVSQYKLEDYVIFHGTKTGQELNELIDMSHIGIGSLGMHRAGLTCGCTLKAREYCARGIPFIIGYTDNGFSDDFKYILKVEPNESSLDINNVIEFYNSLKDEDYINQMRKYAEVNLTWKATMKPIIDSIQEYFNIKTL